MTGAHARVSDVERLECEIETLIVEIDTYWSQVISTGGARSALATAAEILNRVREEVATRNAMSMRGA